MRKKFYFEDFKPGDSQKSISHFVDKTEVIDFARKWDAQPWHVDEEAAKQSMFGGLTACSAHIFSIFCHISPQWESGIEQQVLASLGFDEMKMLKPVYAGDTVYSLATVEQARASATKPDRGIVISRCELFNEQNEALFSIKSTFLVAKRDV